MLSGHLPVQVDIGGGRGGRGRGGGAGPAAAVAAAAAAAAIVVAQWGRARVARIATQRRRTRAGPLVGRPAGKEISAATGCVMYDRDYNEVRFMILRSKEIISANLLIRKPRHGELSILVELNITTHLQEESSSPSCKPNLSGSCLKLEGIAYPEIFIELNSYLLQE